MFVILIGNMVSRMQTHVTCQVVHFKYVQCITCQLCLNKAVNIIKKNPDRSLSLELALLFIPCHFCNCVLLVRAGHLSILGR